MLRHRAFCCHSAVYCMPQCQLLWVPTLMQRVSAHARACMPHAGHLVAPLYVHPELVGEHVLTR